MFAFAGLLATSSLFAAVETTNTYGKDKGSENMYKVECKDHPFYVKSVEILNQDISPREAALQVKKLLVDIAHPYGQFSHECPKHQSIVIRALLRQIVATVKTHNNTNNLLVNNLLVVWHAVSHYGSKDVLSADENGQSTLDYATTYYSLTGDHFFLDQVLKWLFDGGHSLEK